MINFFNSDDDDDLDDDLDDDEFFKDDDDDDIDPLSMNADDIVVMCTGLSLLLRVFTLISPEVKPKINYHIGTLLAKIKDYLRNSSPPNSTISHTDLLMDPKLLVIINQILQHKAAEGKEINEEELASGFKSVLKDYMQPPVKAADDLLNKIIAKNNILNPEENKPKEQKRPQSMDEWLN